MDDPGDFDGPIKMNPLVRDAIPPPDLLVWLGDDVKETHGFLGNLYAESLTYDPLRANFYVDFLEFKNGGIGILNSNRSLSGRALTFEAHGRRTTVFGVIHGSIETDGYVIQRDGTSYLRADEVNAVDLVETPDTPRRMMGFIR